MQVNGTFFKHIFGKCVAILFFFFWLMIYEFKGV